MKKERIMITVYMDKNSGDTLRDDGKTDICFDELFQYPEIVITGGINIQTAPRVVELIHRLGYRGYNGRVIVRMAEYHSQHWAFPMMVKDSDGVEHEIGNLPKQRGIKELRELCRVLEDIPVGKGRQDRLAVGSSIVSGLLSNQIHRAGEYLEIVPIDGLRNGEQAAYCLDR